jgi:Family of unknown function (DUF5684)
VSSTFWIIYTLLIVVWLVAGWQVFEKAGEAGWKILIPIWNILVLLKIVGRPWWWILLMLIPIVTIVIWIIVAIDLSKSFGHGTGFAIGIIFLPFIFLLILGFGSDQYQGPAGGGVAPAAV